MGVRSESGFCGNNGPRSRGIAFFRGGVRHYDQRVLAVLNAWIGHMAGLVSSRPGHCPHLHQEDKQLGMLLQHLLLKVTIFPSKVLQDPEHLYFTQREEMCRL